MRSEDAVGITRRVGSAPVGVADFVDEVLIAVQFSHRRAGARALQGFKQQSDEAPEQ